MSHDDSNFLEISIYNYVKKNIHYNKKIILLVINLQITLYVCINTN